METRVTVSTTMPANPTRLQRRWIREAAAAGADFHHRKHMRRHFESGAASRYGYKPRSKRWQKLKRLMGASSLPLVFTGETKKSVLAGRKITATSMNGARLIMFASLPGFSGRMRMKAGQRFLTRQQEQQLGRVAELQVMTADELAAIAKEEERHYAASMAGSFKGVVRFLTR